MPDRLYVIDRDGKVAYKGGRGPFGFKTNEMEQALLLTLVAQRDEDAKRVEKKAGEVKPKGADAAPAAKPGAFAPMLDNDAAWACMPPLEKGERGALPNWARILARTMPRTTALLLELDYIQRAGNPLDPRVRGLTRLVAAKANRCGYAQAYALADLERLGLTQEAVAQLLTNPPEKDRAILEFAHKMTVAAWSVTDAEAAELRERYGENTLVALIHVLAFANFHDRLIHGLGIDLEPNGPLLPRELKFSREGDVKAPPRTAPMTTAVDAPAGFSDPEWLALDYPALQKAMEAQRARPARVRVPTAEELLKNAPPGLPTNRPPRVRWSMTGYYYAPELTGGWLNTMRMYGAEARQDRVFEELYFWVVTRSLQCFY
jgi:alkylhydroperoxidase family enzyme